MEILRKIGLFIAKVLLNILTTIATSFIIFIVVYCIIRNEFPPDFKKMKQSYITLKNYSEKYGSRITEKFLDRKFGVTDDSDINKLQHIQNQRTKAGNAITGATENNEEVYYDAEECTQQIKSLRRELSTLKNDVFNLNQRLENISDRN